MYKYVDFPLTLLQIPQTKSIGKPKENAIDMVQSSKRMEKPFPDQS